MSFIFETYDEADPVALSLFGRTHSTCFESQRVYPLSVTTEIPPKEPVIVFAALADLTGSDILSPRLHRSDVILIGTLALRDLLPQELAEARPRQILRVASPDWSFYSTEEDVESFVRTLISDQMEVVLFHNSPKTVHRFIKRFDSSSVSRIHVAGAGQIPLS